MSILELIVAVGVGAGVLAVILAVVIERFSAKRRAKAGAHFIPNAPNRNLTLEPSLLISQIGANQEPEFSLDTIIMRPTLGIKLFCLIILALIGILMSAPLGLPFRHPPATVILTVTVVGYFFYFLAVYEVRYDGESVTAPSDILLRPRTFDWKDLISVAQSDGVTYRLTFETGRLNVRKFLVGMPTFLTFITEVREMNKRL